MPKDTPWVKHVRFESPLLSKFWGRPILIGATILLPKDYDRDSGVQYPVNYEQGHFSTQPPGGFAERAEPKPDATERQKERARRQEEFSKAWQSGAFPRMLFVTFQHPTPYYDDSYAIDSPNMGPYGQAITQELIPYIEKNFRAIPQPWARILSGGSTGGWESLALQIFYPDYFGGTFSYCPDPVDFHYFEMVNIYDWDNAWYRKDDWRKTPIPGERQPDGLVLSTMREQLKYEQAMGSGGRSGEDWDCWQAVYGPRRARRLFPAALRSGDRSDRPRRRRVLEGAHGPERVPPAKLEGDRAEARRQDSHLDRRHGHLLPERRGPPSRGLPEDDDLASLGRIDHLRTPRAALLGGALLPRGAAEDDGRLRRRHGAPRRGSAVVARVAPGSHTH